MHPDMRLAHVSCGECGGDVWMKTRVTDTHFIHMCPFGHIHARPRAATRRRISNQPTTVLNSFLWITRPPIDTA